MSRFLGQSWQRLARQRLAGLGLLLAAPITAIQFMGAPCSFGQDSSITLRNGMTIGPGLPSAITTINASAFQQNRQGDSLAKPILMVDDNLRRTFVAAIHAVGDPTPIDTAPTVISISQVKPPTKSTKTIALRPLNVTPFNKFGRRTYTVVTPGGILDLFQGITEIAPTYVKIEGLRGGDVAINWDMRQATSTLTSAEIDMVLRNSLDLSKPDDWFKMVRLYAEAERFREARDTLAEAIAKLGGEYPGELESMRAELKRIEQQYAGQMFREVELRLDSGQPDLALDILQQFPMAQLAIETQLKAQDKLAELQRRRQQVTDLATAMRDLNTALEDAAAKQATSPIVDEIAEKLSTATVDRMSDFARLKDDKTLSMEQRLSLAVGGWLLGSGSGIDNLAVARSLHQARDLIQQYLTSKNEATRSAILAQLRAIEGGAPKYVAGLLANMAPPLALPEPKAEDPPGLFTITIPPAYPYETPTQYTVQLPPEYNPLRKYPCVVSLHNQGAKPEAQIDWWAGPYSEAIKGRAGSATRNGFVVIAPAWAPETQTEYFYSENEHAKVLTALRDAMRRISIDTDRVFLSGNGMGGSAAWDIALSHPDLWAGMICISGDARKFLPRYRDNAKYMPMYFVFGSMSNTLAGPSGPELDTYVSNIKFDTMVVEYIGRVPAHFQEELPRIITWMKLASHQRRPFPKEINVSANRTGERFFWWLEADQLLDNVIQQPLLYDRLNANQGEFEAKIVDPAANRLRVIRIPAKTYTVWLSPEMLDFSRQAQIDMQTNTERLDIQPDIEVMLEDARRRADRQHPFWAKIRNR